MILSFRYKDNIKKIITKRYYLEALRIAKGVMVMDRVDELLQTKEYSQLFEPSIERIKEKYLELAKVYHPDVWMDTRATELFEHITELKEEAIRQLEQGVWEKDHEVFLEMERGGWTSLKYKDTQDTEIGKMFWGADKIMYVIDEDKKKFYDNAVYQLSHLSYRDDSMREEFSPLFPEILKAGIAKNGSGILVIRKGQNEYPLAEIQNRLGGIMEARHVAWIISRMCNICCYLQYRGIAHNGLTIDNLFVDPIDHKIKLYGGWWYAVEQYDSMLGTTAEVYEIMSDRAKGLKQGECITDQEMLHEIAKSLLGNKSMVFKSSEKKSIPDAMAGWIRNGSCGDAIEEFVSWNKVLDESFGPRKFIKLNIPGIC